jgi:cytochrome c biogenesis protein CcmG, thiol:disulfide interchange protein DsbE
MRRILSPIPVAAILVVAALIGLLAYGLSANEPDRGIDRAVARGDRAAPPKLELPLLAGGGTGSLADYRGKVVVLNFWASWCAPCRKESPLLERWHRRISRSAGTVIGVDVLDVSSDAQRFVREFGLTYPMLRDRSGDTIDDFGVAAYPETFVLDRRGRIAATRRGPVDEAFLRRQVVPLLREPS